MNHDVLVIGGGHAGTEAAAMAARLGARTLLVTQNLETIGQMSCNPAIGGIAKGTVAREVDALGGIMGRATDRAMIQFRMLNRSKGPAVWSPRAQCDRGLYRRAVRSLLERLPNVHFAQGTVGRLLLSGERVCGVVLTDGTTIGARSVVLTAGTFLRGRIHLGLDTQIPAGRAGESPTREISEDIVSIGLTVERFKTGTPPRIDGRSVDFSKVQPQQGDAAPYWFSFYEKAEHPRQLPCWITWTDDRLKEIVTEHLPHSALYGGAISGRGPRYCPSIEDKVVRFPNAVRHQVFLEPEGLETHEMYVNGLSTSLPPKIQLEFLRSVPGLEQAEMTRPGYAIEYDYFPPTQLDANLRVKSLQGLYLAGQVNGTTGYEEAAGQGVVAGLNAGAFALEKAPIGFRRDQAFLGVMVDDLVHRGVDEPYRLFTSRAEFRLVLRQDNALRRLFPLATELGLLEESERRVAEERLMREEEVREMAGASAIAPDRAEPELLRAGTSRISEPERIAELAKRPGVRLIELLRAAGADIRPEEAEWADIEIKYQGYLAREAELASRLGRMEDFSLPDELSYLDLATVSIEAREKLDRVRPSTLGQAGRIPGVTPSDLQCLVMEVLKRR